MPQQGKGDPGLRKGGAFLKKSCCGDMLLCWCTVGTGGHRCSGNSSIKSGSPSACQIHPEDRRHPGCVPGPRLGSQAGINQLLGALPLLQLPQPLGFALETAASISMGITKETHAQCTHSLPGHDQSEVPKPFWAVTT